MVIMPARIAAMLERHARLDELRISARGVDAEFDAVMVAFHIAATEWRTTALGRTQAPKPEAGPLSEWVSTAEAGSALHITTRAVVLAISEGRIRANKVSGNWRIAREDLEHHKAARAA
ncbi:hypothetical protein GY21_13555 [Cryobacterium roopkundense]|nr:hypothetical protein GY21_13555 [Cryobacterium roopkundense]